MAVNHASWRERCKRDITAHLVQTQLLVRKNFILMLRQWKSTLAQVLVSMLVISLLYLMIRAVDIQPPNETYHYPLATPVGNIPSCKSSSCYQLVYAPSNDPFVTDIITRIANQNSWNVATDVKAFDDSEAIQKYLVENPDTTHAAITFDTSLSKNKKNKSIHYTIMYNATAPAASAALQLAVDDAIIAHYYAIKNSNNNNNNSKVQQLHKDSMASMAVKAYAKAVGAAANTLFLSIFTKGMPLPPPSDITTTPPEVLMMNSVGAQFMTMSMMLIFVIAAYNIVAEKDKKLRLGMNMMGLKSLPYWISWWFSTFFMCCVISVVIMLLGFALRLSFFTNTNIAVILVVFTAFGMALTSLSFLFAAITSRPKVSLIISFIMVGITYLMNSIFTNAYIVYAMYSIHTDRLLNFIRFLLKFYPPFNFGKCIADIASMALPTQSSMTGQWHRGPGFFWSDLFVELNPNGLYVPPTAQAIQLLYFNAILYFVLAWYLDNIWPWNESTIPKKPWFFLTPSFWGFHAHKPVDLELAKLAAEDHYRSFSSSGAALDADVQQEEQRALNPNSTVGEDNLIRILRLGKQYKTGLFSRTVVDALNGISLVAEQGQCMALLGHNGAGKTTAISILVGLIPPSWGDAWIFGSNVRYEMNEIRRNLGVCPQHDILWDDLTAYEHLRMFAEFKMVPFGDIDAEIETRLREVGLFDVRNQTTKTFSGGMKRRLSVAISLMGSPRIIVLDEPTTGMDPHSRRKVWELIHRMKGDRVILLTSHSMEEAEALADKIAIMAFGKVQCVGNSLHLKNHFGAGYNLNLITSPDKTDQLLRFIAQLLPGSNLVSNNAGNCMFNIPNLTLKQLIPALEQIETRLAAGDGLITDWGISQTTLEEVYLKVTKAANFGYGRSQAQSVSQPRFFSQQQQTAVLPPIQQNLPSSSVTPEGSPIMIKTTQDGQPKQ